MDSSFPLWWKMLISAIGVGIFGFILVEGIDLPPLAIPVLVLMITGAPLAVKVDRILRKNGNGGDK